MQLTVGMVDGRRLVVSIEEDGRDLDTAVGHILTSLSSIFPGVSTEYVLCKASTVDACCFLPVL